jgi:serine/threonine protein kinase
MSSFKPPPPRRPRKHELDPPPLKMPSEGARTKNAETQSPQPPSNKAGSPSEASVQSLGSDRWIQVQKLPGSEFAVVSPDGHDPMLMLTMPIGQGNQKTVYLAQNKQGPLAITVVQSSAATANAYDLHDEALSSPRRASVGFGDFDRLSKVAGSESYTAANGRGYNLTPVMKVTLTDVMLAMNDAVLPHIQRMTIALLIVRDGAEALLDTRRKHNVANLDITPANLMIDGAGKIQVVDVGTAPPIGPFLDGTNMTWGFLAPEFFKRDATNEVADVWSLGATALAVALGESSPFDPAVREPFEQAAKDQVAKFSEYAVWTKTVLKEAKVSEDTLPFSSVYNVMHEAHPETCDFIFKKLLEIRPEKRASLSDAFEESARILQGMPPGVVQSAVQFLADIPDPKAAKLDELRDTFQRWHTPSPITTSKEKEDKT